MTLSESVLSIPAVTSIPLIPKVCSADHWWSANPYTNQYFVLRGALKYFKWSALRTSLGTTCVGPDTQRLLNCISDTRQLCLSICFIVSIVFEAWVSDWNVVLFNILEVDAASELSPDQWFPTGVPRHTRVPWAGARGATNNYNSVIFIPNKQLGVPPDIFKTK